jgi:hypothetical protein
VAAVCSRVISWTGNGKRGRGRPNLGGVREERFEGLKYHQEISIR